MGDAAAGGYEPEGRSTPCPVLFQLVCAEHLAKLADRAEPDGRSRHYTKALFRQFASDADRRLLGNGFMNLARHPLGWESAVDALYGGCCDVVHEGNFWDFTLGRPDLPTLNQDRDLIARLSIQEFRDLIFYGQRTPTTPHSIGTSALPREG